jgi:hypothetical protein
VELHLQQLLVVVVGVVELLVTLAHREALVVEKLFQLQLVPVLV